MACGRPVLLVGPAASHAGELIDEHACGWQVNHGDDAQLVAVIEDAVAARRGATCRDGPPARAAISLTLSKSALCGALLR